jgi:hypothetical protein
MKRWAVLAAIAGLFTSVWGARPAVAASSGQSLGLSGSARSFQLGDLASLADMLGLGGGGLGSLGDLLGLGGDSDALGGLLGDILGGLGGLGGGLGGYSDRDPYEGDWLRQPSRQRNRQFAQQRLFSRIDRSGNRFLERPELSRYARRPARGSRSPQATFNRLDRNRDGRLSRSEFGRLFR